MDTEVGIPSISNENLAIKVYPNPVSSLLYVETTSPNQQIKEININDLNGRNAISSEQIPINISDISQGIYFYQLNMSNGDVVRGKFVKR